jgi:hypothetical protein
MCLVIETSHVAGWSLITHHLGSVGDAATLTWSELDRAVGGLLASAETADRPEMSSAGSARTEPANGLGVQPRLTKTPVRNALLQRPMFDVLTEAPEPTPGTPWDTSRTGRNSFQ